MKPTPIWSCSTRSTPVSARKIIPVGIHYWFCVWLWLKCSKLLPVNNKTLVNAFSICLCRNSYPHRKSFPQCESALFCTKHSECRFMRKGTTIIRTSKTLSPIHIQEYTHPHTGWYGDGCYQFCLWADSNYKSAACSCSEFLIWKSLSHYRCEQSPLGRCMHRF